MNKLYHKYGPLLESFLIMVIFGFTLSSFGYEIKAEQFSIAFATYLYLAIYRKTFEEKNDES